MLGTLNYWQIVFGYLMYVVTPFMGEIALAILNLAEIRYYVISGDKETYRRTVKLIESTSRSFAMRNISGRESPSGYFIGWSVVGYIENRGSYEEDNKIYAVCPIAFYKTITAGSSAKFKSSSGSSGSDETDGLLTTTNDISGCTTSTEQQKIEVYHRVGTYKNFYYRSLNLDVSDMNPVGDQVEIVNDIVRIYKTKGRAAVFIHGVSCAGKSSIGYLVAKAIQGNFCHTFNPTDPGDQFPLMIHELLHNDSDSPAVVVLEEANEIIRAVHTKTTVRVPDIPTPVRDKPTWVTMMDDLKLFKNVVMILTSNESKAAMDALDVAYLAASRIHATYEMSRVLPIYETES